MEIAVPLYELRIGPRTTPTWRINCCRTARTAPAVERSAVADRGTFNEPACFVQLAPVDLDFRRYCVSVSPPESSMRFVDGKTQVSIESQVVSGSQADRTLKAESWLIDADGKVQIREVPPFALKGGESIALKFEPCTVDKGGVFRHYLYVRENGKRAPLAVARNELRVQSAPMTVRITDQVYRNTIFSTMDLARATGEVQILIPVEQLKGASLRISLLPLGEERAILETSIKDPAAVNSFAFDNAKIPEGRFVVRAGLTGADGADLGSGDVRLDKLPRKSGEVWVGADRVFRRDGKPLFPLGAWGQSYPGFNYVWAKATSPRRSEAPSDGMLRVYMLFLRADYPALSSPKPLDKAFLDSLRERVRRHRDSPDILAWFTYDEPEANGTPATRLKEVYDVLREEDPYHPVIVGNDSTSGAKDYLDCADCGVPHPYPTIRSDVRINDAQKLLEIQDAYLRATHGQKAVGFTHQGFNYGDVRLGQRMPSYYELRNQNLLALTAGATILLQYQAAWAYVGYPEQDIGFPLLARELEFLGPAVAAAQSKLAVTTAEKSVRTLLKSGADGREWLFVANASSDERPITVKADGWHPPKLHVLSEGRTVEAPGGTLTDAFEPWEVHVYMAFAPATPLQKVKDISAEIEAEYAKHRKPGNLAWQRWAEQSVEVTYSSRSKDTTPIPWHICDGLAPDKEHLNSPERQMWMDGGDGKTPEWLAVKFKQSHSINRVAVAMLDRSIKSWKVQIMKGQEWVVVAEGADYDKDWIDASFAPVMTDQVRLLVEERRGQHIMVTELEVYGQ